MPRFVYSYICLVMSIFPTQYSVLSAAALNNFLQHRYGFSNTTTCRLLIHNVSDTYVIESAGEKYIFKIYRDAHRKLDEIKGEAELLAILKNKGAKVSYPISDLEENLIQNFNAAEGTRYGILFSWAQGNPVYVLSNDQLKLLGQEMAVLHNITATVTLKYPRKPYNIETMLTGPIKTIKPAFDGLEEDYAYLQEAVTKVALWMQEADTSGFSYGYCQYDFLPKNFHFSDDGGITFFDFDFAGQGYLVNDLASFYIHYFLEVYYGKITQEEADRAFGVFIDGYSKMRPVSKAELEAIPYFGFAFWIFYFGFHYENFDDWSNLFFTPRFIKDRVTLIKKWESWYIKY